MQEPDQPSHSPPPASALDPRARAELAGWVRQHWDAVFALLFRLSGNRHETEDLAQETFLRAAQRRGSFADGTNLRAWLMRIATNAFLDGRRRRQTASPAPLPQDLKDPSRGADADAALKNRELSDALAAALLQLPDTARVVFLLRTREEMSFKQIADMIGATEQTARWHMHQARRRLMELLDGWM